VLVFLAVTGASPRSDRQILAEFRYSQFMDGEESRISGLYHQDAERVLICVQQPLRQWIRIAADGVMIYYPEESKALRLGPASPFSNPFYLLFLGSAGPDLNLSRLGFRLSSKTVRRDTLITLWSPPEALASNLREARLTIAHDRLSSMELTAADGTLLEAVRFSDYGKAGALEFPFSLEMTGPPPNPSREVIHLSGVQVGVVPADSIARFAVPADIRIEDVSR
jgi:hypothetical protein